MTRLVNFMVDIETLGVEPDTTILSIGAVQFDREFKIVQEFYTELNTSKQARTVNIDTIRWWSNNSAPIPGDTPESIELIQGLTSLTDFIINNSIQATPIIWCKGPQFDAAILTNAYNCAGIPTPWMYSDVRDLRTVLKLTNCPKAVASHNALQDCKDQVNQLAFAFDALGIFLPVEKEV